MTEVLIDLVNLMEINWESYVKALPDYIIATAALGGLVTAWMGLSTWKQQMRGSTEYELAKRLLMGVYKTRDTIRGYVIPG